MPEIKYCYAHQYEIDRRTVEKVLRLIDRPDCKTASQLIRKELVKYELKTKVHEMKITEGTYRRRDGSIVIIRKINDLSDPWFDQNGNLYTVNGRYISNNIEHECDLIERIEDQTSVQPDVLTIVNLIAALPEQKRRAVIEIFKES
jgi:hypothetical protein